jgi:hypothetical protein
MYKIVGRYKGCEREYIDEFDTREEANAMLTEYKMAYGNDFALWIECE